MKANSIIAKSNLREKEISQKVKKIDKTALKLYKPFYDGLWKGSHMSLMVNFISMFRRLATFYPAMFLADHSWMQVIIFMSFSLF